MRAVKLTGARKLEPVEVADPEAEENNVIMDVLACGICGSDLHYWEMGVGMDGKPGLIPGHEFCGTVADPGPRSDLQPGDRVTYIPLNPCGVCPTCQKGLFHICQKAFTRPIPGNNAPGAFAEKVAGRADMVRKLPDSLSDEEACLVEPAAVALHAIRQAGFRVGDKVLITGGGTIGLLSAAWARIAGAGLVGLCEVNPHRLEHAGNWQYVDEVFDGRDEKLRRKLKQASDGGFDAVVETSAVDAGLFTAMSALKPGGTVVLAGINFSAQSVSTLMLTSKELVQKGSMAYAIDEFDTSLAFMADKRLDTAGMVNCRPGFSDLQETFERLHAGTPEIVKAVVRP
ncbi:MAG: zinc-dependent alcohol dehydrogenase [Desulfobacterales bacterium]